MGASVPRARSRSFSPRSRAALSPHRSRTNSSTSSIARRFPSFRAGRAEAKNLSAFGVRAPDDELVLRPRRPDRTSLGPLARAVGSSVALFLLVIAATPARAETWRYRVRLEGEYLRVEAALPSCADLTIAEEGEAFVEERTIEGKAPCTVRYRFALLKAAREHDDAMSAFEKNGAMVAPASTWLVRPDRAEAQDTFRITVDPKTHAALGLERVGD